MAKRMLSKAMAAGKVAAFCVGLAVVLALTVGAATSATAANGKPFLLGKSNVATKVSNLVNRGIGPALGLKVGADQPPLTVNAEAGTATNLSADELDGKDSGAFLGKSEKAVDADKLDGQDSSAFAGFGESAYAAGGSVTPCATVELASISNISVSRPSRIYATGAMVYFPGQAASSLKYGEITIELRNSANNTVASAGKMYGSTTGAEDIPLSMQGVLMSGTNPHSSAGPFVAQPGNTYTLRLTGRSSSGTCDNNNPPYMKDRALSYVLLGSTR